MSEAPYEPLSIQKVREVIDHVLNPKHKIFLKTSYLTASRVSELITKVCPWDLAHLQTQAYGQSLRWSFADFRYEVQVGKEKRQRIEKVLVLQIAVAKRKKKNKDGTTKLVFKSIALPTSPTFEPWTIDLLKHIEQHGTLAFDYTRFNVNQVIHNNFRPLMPNISTMLNPLRHLRITHLVTEYGFNPYDITSYAGWTFKTTAGQMGMASASGQLDAYLHLAWRQYFPKLMIPIQA